MGHLHLVTDTNPAPRHKRGRARSLRLTDDEVRHLRASVRGLARTRYGTLAALARALDVDPAVLTRTKRPGAALAVALWRLTGVPLSQLLTAPLAIVAPLEPGAPGGAS